MSSNDSDSVLQAISTTFLRSAIFEKKMEGNFTLPNLQSPEFKYVKRVASLHFLFQSIIVLVVSRLSV